MHPTNKGLSHLMAATKYSMQGLKVMLSGVAFRQELIMGVIMLPIIWFALPLEILWKTFMTIIWLMLPTMEIINTAIEAVVDLVSPDFHPLAGQAKDLGSAGVFCAITANVFVWIAAIAQIVLARI
jgi:diacylglycerol kinase (ATP)